MSIGADLKALVDPVFNGRVYRDDSPERAAYPLATFLQDVSDTPSLKGSGHALRRRRLLQLDVWQKTADETDTVIQAVWNAIDGKPAPGGHWAIVDVNRFYEDDVVHHAFTVAVPSP